MSHSEGKLIRRVFFTSRRFVSNGKDFEKSKEKVENWRIKERMKTVCVALVCCLNIGVDPPDVVKNSPQLRMECWTDVNSEPPEKALEAIGNNLQEQYERWQPRAFYKQCLDPIYEDVRQLCTSIRRIAKDERVLLHYNGHGVPKPTSNGEIWVFNKNYTQYIPLSIYELQSWMESPSIYIFDCSASGLILQWYVHFARQRQCDQSTSTNIFQNSILLAPCAANETLPSNPLFPSDLFTACLTTPVKMALYWFCSTNLNSSISTKLIDMIPGRLSDRQSILGQLNWIFTSITDTIAWNMFPPALFQHLFRQDLLVASLFRNFLLAERILRASKCTPTSIPKLPSTSHHPLWRSWDFTVDLCLSYLSYTNNSPFSDFPRITFFEDQLSAFEIWLQFASEAKVKDNRAPEQLPIVLQVLLNQTHRFRALILLARFLDLGIWAVNFALSVGIFPYVLKLLQSPASDLREVLIFIWAKLLAIDQSCRLDLVKEKGHKYFVNILNDFEPSFFENSPGKMSLISSSSLPHFTTLDFKSILDSLTLSVFILSVVCENCRPGQMACLSLGLLPLFLKFLTKSHPLLRYWLVFCLGMLWKDFEEAKDVAIRENAHEKLRALLTDPVPEVRAASIFSIGTFISGDRVAESRQHIELNLSLSLQVALCDASPLVRKELVKTLYIVANGYSDSFHEVLSEIDFNHILLYQTGDKPKQITPPLPSKEADHEQCLFEPPEDKITFISSGKFGFLWKMLLNMKFDPFPEVAQLADFVVNNILNFAGIHSSLSSLSSNGNHQWVSSGVGSILSPSVDLSRAKSSSSILRGGSLRNIFSVSKSSIESDEREISPEFSPNIEQREYVSLSSSSFRNFLRTDNSMPSNSNISDDSSGFSHQTNDQNSNLQELRSCLFSWACGICSSPLLKPIEFDVTSPSHLKNVWRNIRNNTILSEAIRMGNRGTSCFRRFGEQIASLDNLAENVSSLLFHPYDDILLICDMSDQIQVWSWREKIRVAYFGNCSSHGCLLSGILLINDNAHPLMCTAASDFVVRVWDHPSLSNFSDKFSITRGGPSVSTSSQTLFSNVSSKLVTSFRGLPYLSLSKKVVGNHMIIDWIQKFGLLLISGDINLIRIWNVDQELCSDDIQLQDVSVNSLTNDSGTSVIAGCYDGSVRIFDTRSLSNHLTLFQENRVRVLNVHQSKIQNTLLAGNSDGSVALWDLRNTSQLLKTVNCFKGEASTCSVHDFLPLFAVGSHRQKIKVFNFEGQELSVLRYHTGFLGQRVCPISALAFHSFKPFLAAGSRDSLVTVYGANVNL